MDDRERRVMAYGGLVCRIKTREHSNADSLAVGNCAGYQVIVSKDTEDGAKGLFFMSDTQLSHAFCMANGLYRKDPVTGVELGGYLESNRRVRTIKLRGETSDGLWLPLTCLDHFPASALHSVQLGIEINKLAGDDNLAKKYETPATQRAKQRAALVKGNKKNRNPKFPTFHKHYDTPQLRNNLARIPEGALITVTEKLHGTSGRSGHLKCEHPPTWFQSLFKRPGKTEWKHIMGSRNITIHDNTKEIRKINPQYEANDYRTLQHRKLSLKKGETIYYEIVGWSGGHGPRDLDGGLINAPSRIMPAYSVDDSSDPIRKEIKKRFKTDKVDFTYGLRMGDNEIYVYRITQTNEDGDSTELAWHQVVRRCEDMGLKHVPILDQFIYKRPVAEDRYGLDYDPDYEKPDMVLDYAKRACSGPSYLDPNSIKEGVCVRVEHPDCSHTFKYKSFWFCHLEGIAKQDDGYVDLEDVS